MDEIGRIIFNSLVSRRPVWLPCVGTFRSEYTPARDNGDGTVTPPYHAVAFSEGHDGDAVPVTDMLGHEPGGDTPQTRYDRWLVKATERGPVVIDGIGVVNNGIFTPYETLINSLNPIPHSKSAAVKPAAKKGLGRNEKIWLVFIALFILILAGGWTWWYKYNGTPSGHNKWNTHNPAATDNLDNIPEPIATVGGTQSPEAAVDATEVAVVPTTEADSGSEVPSAVSEPAVPAATTPAQPAQSVSGAAGAGFYVVGGVFSVPENADKYIREMSAKYPDFDYKKHPYSNGKVLVSLFGSTDRHEASRQQRRIEDTIYEYDLWVYEVK